LPCSIPKLKEKYNDAMIKSTYVVVSQVSH